MKRIVLTAALAATVALPTVTAAQGGPGFLFERPRVSIGFRTGLATARASGQLFEDARRELSLNNWDFARPYVGGEIAARVSERWDVALAAGWAGRQSQSHLRDWTEGDLLIRQETTFQTASATIGGRYYFDDRGRAIGRFAWVPSRLTPFVGAGVGMAWYQFAQSGDFVDEQDPACPSACPIYTDDVETSGSGPLAYVGGGADLSIGKQFYLTGDARYNFGNGGVQDFYSEYDGIDLSGLQLTAGISLRW